MLLVVEDAGKQAVVLQRGVLQTQPQRVLLIGQLLGDVTSVGPVVEVGVGVGVRPAGGGWAVSAAC